MHDDRQQAQRDNLPTIYVHGHKGVVWFFAIGGTLLIVISVLLAATRWQEKDVPWVSGGGIVFGMTLLVLGWLSRDGRPRRPRLVIYSDGFELPGMQDGGFLWNEMQTVTVIEVRVNGLVHWLGIRLTDKSKSERKLPSETNAAMKMLTLFRSPNIDFAFPVQMMSYGAHAIAEEMTARMAGVGGPITKQLLASAAEEGESEGQKEDSATPREH